MMLQRDETYQHIVDNKVKKRNRSTGISGDRKFASLLLEKSREVKLRIVSEFSYFVC